jgi:hypothetical protein
MMSRDALSNYKKNLSDFVRAREVKRAGGDLEKLTELENTADEFLLKRLLWTGSIVAGPLVFIALPVVLSLLSVFLPSLIMNVLWVLAKMAMGLVLVSFVLMSIITSGSGE